jgi:hypothetical protein
MSKRVHWMLKTGISAALLLLLFVWVDWKAGFQVMAEVDLLLLLPYAALFPLALVVAAKRWIELLVPHGIELPLARVVKIYWICTYLSNFLPSNIGGDVSRVGFLCRLNKTAQVAGSILAERFIGFVVLLLFTAVAATVRPEIFLWKEGAFLFWAGIAVGLAGASGFLLYSNRLAGWFMAVKGHGPIVVILKKVGKLLVALETYRNGKMIIKVVGWSILYYIVGLLAHYTVAMSLGLNLDFVSILSVAPFVWLISMLPVSINAIGLAEGAFVVCYHQVGLSRPEALAFALLLRFAQTLCSSIGGGLLLTVNKENDEDRIC